jgi:hypothetical protein
VYKKVHTIELFKVDRKWSGEQMPLRKPENMTLPVAEYKPQKGRVLFESRTIRLSKTDTQTFHDMAEDNSPPNAAMVKAAARLLHTQKTD